MATLKDFTVTKPRPLPVILLADVSGSMASEGKIDALNPVGEGDGFHICRRG